MCLLKLINQNVVFLMSLFFRVFQQMLYQEYLRQSVGDSEF